MQVGAGWRFGVEGAWTLAPTRHGAHNWEGMGMHTSMAALNALHRWTAAGRDPGGPALPDRPAVLPADPSRVLVAGHSMGGHGAWILATHQPDRAVAVASVAGWIRKEYYGDSNNLFDHDLGVAHADAALKATLEATVLDNYADLLSPNLKGLQVLVRIGAEDRSVPPWQQRRMLRHLLEHRVTVTYHEVRGKEHWWWDSDRKSDGGCVNDDAMRAFFRTSLQPVHGAAVPPPPERMELVLVNPASHGSRGGLKVLQQVRPHAQSRIEVHLPAAGPRRLRTHNVRRLALVEVAGAAEPRFLPPAGWIIDQTPLSVEQVKELYGGWAREGTHLCLQPYHPAAAGSAKRWSMCNASFAWQERSPGTYGPARHVLAAPFLLVAGSGPNSTGPDPVVVEPGPDSACAAAAGGGGRGGERPLAEQLLSGAVYLANLHRLASDAHAPVFLDRLLSPQLAHGHNLLLVGGPFDNGWARMLAQTGSALGRLPVRFGPAPAHALGPALGPGSFAIGHCIFSGPGLGLVFTFPLHLAGPAQSDSDRPPCLESGVGGCLGLMVAGTDSDGLVDALSLGAPTIPPMVRSPFTNMVPDFVVTGPEYRWKGIGGMLAAGSWDNHWAPSPATSYFRDSDGSNCLQ